MDFFTSVFSSATGSIAALLASAVVGWFTKLLRDRPQVESIGDQDLFLLRAYGSAQTTPLREDRTDALTDASIEVRHELGWDVHQLAEAVNRLHQRGWIEATIQKDGSHRYEVAIPREVTAAGFDRIEHQEPPLLKQQWFLTVIGLVVSIGLLVVGIAGLVITIQSS